MAAMILEESVPTIMAAPTATASGRSDTSRVINTGFPRLGASSWMPPLSVTTNWHLCNRETN